MQFRHAYSVIMLLTVSTISHAQPDSLWSRTFGGSSQELCSSIQQTFDGGYVLSGISESFGAGLRDFWLVKTDTHGDSLWSRNFGGSNNENCHSMQQTTDGGYILAGDTWSYGAGESDFWLVKTDANGNRLWSHTFGGIGADKCWSIQQTYDGGYVLAGYTGSFGAGSRDFWLVKTDANGDSLWSRTFGGNSDDNCHSIQQTTDGGYVLAGYTESFGAGDQDFWMVKTNANGDSLWSRTYDGNNDENCHSVQQTADGGYVLAGSVFGADNASFWLVKTDANGDSLWTRTYSGSLWDECHSVQQTSDDGYVLAGHVWVMGAGEFEFWIVRTNANGDIMWNRTFGGSDYEICYSVHLTDDGGYALAGVTNSLGAGDFDFWLVKTGLDPTTDVDNLFAPLPSFIEISTYPNPFNSELTLDVTGFARDVRITLHNLLGQEVDVIHEGVLAGSRIQYLAPATLSSGLYFVRESDARNVKTVKVVYLK
ncbi:T9SS type A sorting domain-containing protein [bacterium]|nr:T9SS type A sorting domain-containing protein [bacterium]MBU1638116.1 T9SS type A sorting domain-containing protein [bacterium]